MATIEFINDEMLVSVWHYQATYKSFDVANGLVRNFPDESKPYMKHGYIALNSMRFELGQQFTDIIEDLITYHNLKPIKIIQL